MGIDREQPRVSIVISNYNGENLLPECLESLGRLNYSNYEIIVVDAHSTDHSRELVSARYPAVSLIALPERCGVAAALNRGIKAARGDIIVIDFNVDETAEPDWLDNVVAVLERNQEQKLLAGGARLICGSQRIVDDMGMSYIHPFGVATKRFRGRPLDDCPKDPQEVHYLNMIAAYSKAYRTLGPLDEKIFFWGEDAEYCLRARRAGYKIMVVPQAITWHKVSSTVINQPERQAYYLRRGMLYLVLKHYPWYLLPFGLAGNALVFCLDIGLMIPGMHRVLPGIRYSMFARRRCSGEIWADVRASLWNLKHLPRTLRSRNEKRLWQGG